MKTTKSNINASSIHPVVREHYADAAIRSSGCCGGGSTKSNCCGGENEAKYTGSEFYEIEAFENIPEDVSSFSLGCGNPIALASLLQGEVVLDLGSGGGLDCFIASKKVGASGRVIGVDMTPEMLDKARTNLEKLGIPNVEFRLGEIEHLPVSDMSVDVVISNCVINLSPNKPQVFQEIFRVLKSGGRLAVSDIVTDGDLPEKLTKDIEAWAGCISGALGVGELKEILQRTGFVKSRVEPKYFEKKSLSDLGISKEQYNVESLKYTIFSADISAIKP